jgi:hypothetical protein
MCEKNIFNVAEFLFCGTMVNAENKAVEKKFWIFFFSLDVPVIEPYYLARA